MKNKVGSACLGGVLLLAGAQGAQAEDLPLWELGLGVGALSFPAYRGSDEQNQFLLPVPYFTYHGDIFKADRHGVRGEVFESDRLDFTVSAALSPPVASDDARARTGMPDLKATFELGPEIDLTLWRSANRARSLKLLIPARAAFTLEGPPRDIGWVVHPRFNLDLTDLPGFPGWNLGLQAGPVFGDRRQHAYFYEVAPRFVLADRPAYSAHSGFSGMQYLAAVSKRFPGLWVGAFARYDNLSGAVFEDSPLVKRADNFSGGVAVSWILRESAIRVRVDD